MLARENLATVVASTQQCERVQKYNPKRYDFYLLRHTTRATADSENPKDDHEDRLADLNLQHENMLWTTHRNAPHQY
jgi:hypothetical protein